MKYIKINEPGPNRAMRRKRSKVGRSYDKNGNYLGKTTDPGYHKGCSGSKRPDYVTKYTGGKH